MATPTDVPPTAPAVPVVPVVVAPPPALKPGWQTSEAWISFLVALPGLILSSGLVANATTLDKIVSLTASVLAALGYTTNRTALKRAHLAMHAGQPTPRRAPLAIAGMMLVALGVATSAATAPGCAGCGSTIGQAAGSAGSAFLACEKINLEGYVTINGKTATLLETVATDLVSANYVQAIADLIVALGSDAVGCAMLAIDDVTNAGKTSGAAALTPIQLRARELIARYHWRAAPPPAPANAGSGGK